MHCGWLVCWVLLSGGEPTPMVIDSALLTVAEQAEVPARDAGVLIEITAREGMSVSEGELLATLDDSEAKLAVTKASVDLERARKLAANDIQLRLAQVELDFAKSELLRALDAEKRLADSVSDAEFDRLRSNGKRATLELEQARFESETAKLSVSLFENELRLAEEKLRRRKIQAPISGVVVTLAKRRGEWVEPGQSVVRILATAKLRVEFFLRADQATDQLIGKKVTFKIGGEANRPSAAEGRIAVVSPEVDPLNGQVRVWAEIDNRENTLRPGLTGSLVIEP